MTPQTPAPGRRRITPGAGLTLMLAAAVALTACTPSEPVGVGLDTTAAPTSSAPAATGDLGAGDVPRPTKAASVGAAVARAVRHSPPAWVHPLPGSCRPPYGGGEYLAPRAGYRHQGIDLGSRATGWQPYGTPVRSIGGGVATVAGWAGPKAGNQVQVVIGLGSPDAITVKANHLAWLGVRRGQWVNPGQTIGGMGATGNASGAHLHLEVWRWGSHRDPVAFLRSEGVEIGCT